MSETATLNIEVVLRPMSERAKQYADALDELADYVEDSPWCGLKEALEVFASVLVVQEEPPT